MQPHVLIKSIADISKRPTRQYYFGIDLGTTYSAIAAFDVFGLAGATMPVSVVDVEQPTDQGSKISPLFPSVVFCRPDGNIIYGEGAKAYRPRPAVRGRNIFYSVKSEMGLGREPFYVDAEDSPTGYTV